MEVILFYFFWESNNSKSLTSNWCNVKISQQTITQTNTMKLYNITLVFWQLCTKHKNKKDLMRLKYYKQDPPASQSVFTSFITKKKYIFISFFNKLTVLWIFVCFISEEGAAAAEPRLFIGTTHVLLTRTLQSELSLYFNALEN